MTDEHKCAHLRITGHVQGVFFRASTRQQARDHGLVGWVVNRADGSVEAALEGPAAAVKAVIEWAHHGPEAADVSEVEVQWTAPGSAGDSFEIRR